MSDLKELFAELAKAKAEAKKLQEQTPAGQALKGVQERLKQNNDIGELMEVFVEKKTQPKEIIKEVVVEKEVVKEQSFQQPNPQEVDANIKAIQLKLKFLEQAIGKIAATGPGGGEVNLRWLDDVDRSTIADQLYLRYNDQTKKFMFDRGHYNSYYGAFQSTATQNCNASTATAFTYNTVDFSYNVSISNNSRVVLEYPGVYNIQFSAQFLNSGQQIDSAYIWLRQNQTDVPGSSGKVDVPSSHGGVPGAILTAWNYYISTQNSNEYFELMWFAADETHISVTAIPAQSAVVNVSPNIPSAASIILTVSPVYILT